ncbi:phospholipid N-methyltransferase [Evansella vedderi]|uniref:Phospholipid N-methyltransferase n=1 Tax=Evansella vedderi TaxID=38282 RepID=A0ABT9ZTW4_9BACI|nr:rRNA adenine N-6-methyltransferase family protein [Evansella vedderi]MDQ0254644.1 phospholipid N-methyltransferase [Evansella vedderi]
MGKVWIGFENGKYYYNEGDQKETMSTMVYLKNLIKDKNIASITPTSKSAVRQLCKTINFNKPLVIVEYGPATGVFTEYFLKEMTDDSMVIAIELNDNFVDYLRKNIKDKRLKIYHDSAENIDQILEKLEITNVDYIVSGIPFTLMDTDLRKRIIQKTNSALRKGGEFLAYQTFFQKDEHLKDYLVKEFREVTDKIAYKNIPPLRTYRAIR